MIVAGGAGFIGSHLIRALLARGHDVLCLDNLSTGKRTKIADLEGNPHFQFLEADITDPLPASLAQRPLTIIWNLASPASPIAYQAQPLKTLLAGSLGSLNLLRLAQASGARYLFTSTSEVYGDPKEHPQPESYWGNVNSYGPRACYDESKRFSEALTYTFRRHFGVKTGIVRIFNTYGPLMERDDGRVISNFVVQALTGAPLTVYGDGTQARSFCYIADMINGLLRFQEADLEGPINLGNPEEYRVIDLARKVLDLTGSNSPIVFKPLPQDDPRQRRPDIRLARKLLGWQPKTKLDHGLEKTIAWFREALRSEKG